jgi:hypothetical protein
MVREGYTAETDYYVLKGENPIYGRDPDALTKEWEESLEGNVGDWELWDDMSTDHLEERLASFGVEVA